MFSLSGRAQELIWLILRFLTVQAPTAAAVAAGGVTEESREGTDDTGLWSVDSGGHRKRFRRLSMSC